MSFWSGVFMGVADTYKLRSPIIKDWRAAAHPPLSYCSDARPGLKASTEKRRRVKAEHSLE
jgi:hypothetical protein